MLGEFLIVRQIIKFQVEAYTTDYRTIEISDAWKRLSSKRRKSLCVAFVVFLRVTFGRDYLPSVGNLCVLPL